MIGANKKEGSQGSEVAKRPQPYGVEDVIEGTLVPCSPRFFRCI
jgi:hypothetical protein